MADRQVKIQIYNITQLWISMLDLLNGGMSGSSYHVVLQYWREHMSDAHTHLPLFVRKNCKECGTDWQ